jgi:hypothetical protein
MRPKRQAANDSGKKSAVKQVGVLPTASTKKPQSVTLALMGEPGFELKDEIELPGELFDAVKAAAKASGMYPADYIAGAIREKINHDSIYSRDHTARENQQKPQSETEGETPALLNPSHAAIDMQDAAALYVSALNDAWSLAMVLAGNIEWGNKSFSGWEKLEGSHEKFADGIYGMVNTVFLKAVRTAERFDADHYPLIKGLGDIAAPVAPMPKRARLAPELEGSARERDAEINRALLKTFGFDCVTVDTTTIQNSGFNAPWELLELLGVVLAERAPDKVGYFASQSVRAELKDRFDLLWKASNQLEAAALAVVYWRSQEKQMAA